LMRIQLASLPIPSVALTTVVLVLPRHSFERVSQPVMNYVTAVVWFTAAMMTSGRNLRRVHAWLRRLTMSEQARAAAAIAAMVGGHKRASEALSVAESRFGGVPFDALEESDFGHCDMGALSSKVVKLQLGQCDAFLSHSWRDNASLKWAALSQWSLAFHRERGQYPTIWLDKACIDQQDIDASLACLPIFLAACCTLVIIPGATYPTRLWCVMEVFTFIKATGGDPAELERITVLPIGQDATSSTVGVSALLARTVRKLEAFDASCAQCFKTEDRDRLLSIIEAGYGDFREFNTIVRKALEQRMSFEHCCVGLSAPRTHSQAKKWGSARSAMMWNGDVRRV